MHPVEVTVRHYNIPVSDAPRLFWTNVIQLRRAAEHEHVIALIRGYMMRMSDRNQRVRDFQCRPRDVLGPHSVSRAYLGGSPPNAQRNHATEHLF